jgi:hypothetical protein
MSESKTTIICKECGVELDEDMSTCPLCGTSVRSGNSRERRHRQTVAERQPEIHKKQLLQRVLWQVTSILLLSGVVATLVIDLSIHRSVTWSVYPVCLCLMIFSYAALMALWHSKIIFQILGGWLISTLVLIALNFLMNGIHWPLQLAFPILCVVNIMGILLVIIIERIKTKSLNILSMIFVAVAIACLVIDGIISFYFNKRISLQWSVIVAACLLPVTAALLFMYFKTRNNTDLQKIFHT